MGKVGRDGGRWSVGRTARVELMLMIDVKGYRSRTHVQEEAIDTHPI